MIKVQYNLNGKKRRKIADIISNITGCQIDYLGTPSYAYQVGDVYIDRDGLVSYSDDWEGIHKKLLEEGFSTDETVNKESDSFVIDLPRRDYSDKDLGKLKNLLASKERLLRKATLADRIQVQATDEKIIFDWFDEMPDQEMCQALVKLIPALMHLAKKSKWISAKETKTDNEKYTFRTFLLRLDFIGDEYKDARRVLLKDLSGNASFRREKEGNHEDNH